MIAWSLTDNFLGGIDELVAVERKGFKGGETADGLGQSLELVAVETEVFKLGEAANGLRQGEAGCCPDKAFRAWRGRQWPRVGSGVGCY